MYFVLIPFIIKVQVVFAKKKRLKTHYILLSIDTFLIDGLLLNTSFTK